MSEEEFSPDTSDFEKIRKKCLEEKKLFEDEDFPAKNESIFLHKEVPDNVEWLRPKEILKRQGLKKEPIFVKDGGSRMDIKQGQLSDCWVLAAAAAVCNYKEAFEWLVPQDQSFEPDWYAGIFRFRIFQYDEWVEVYVDDRLPTIYGGQILMMASSTDKNIFWGCLLEKAYAKLNGSYGAIEYGSNAESLTDFTGGISEFYYLHEVDHLKALLKKAFDRTTIVASSIFNVAPVDNGLVAGHAYSVTSFGEAKKKLLDKCQPLVRVRNPWGTKEEWKGTWSDNSVEWETLTDESKSMLGAIKADDGEFWMSVSDFKWEFHSITLCNFTRKDVQASFTKNWAVVTHYGTWVKGIDATGPPKTKEAFEKCQQVYMKLEDYDKDDVASVIIQLTQKGRRQTAEGIKGIGFAICKKPKGSEFPITFEEASDDGALVGVYFQKFRDVTKRFYLEPGEYVVLPFAEEEGLQSEYILRIISEASLKTKYRLENN